MEEISREKFRKFRDQIIAILEKAEKEGIAVTHLCAAAINETQNCYGRYFRVESGPLISAPDLDRLWHKS